MIKIREEVLSQQEIDELIKILIPGWEPPQMKVLSDRELQSLLNMLSESEVDVLPEQEDDIDDEESLIEALKFFEEMEEERLGLPLRYEDGNYYRFSFKDGLIPCDGLNDPENRIKK